jgi:hypothetical protein
MKLQGYTDSEWEGNGVDQKSTSRCFFILGSGMISWLRRKHTSMALSIVEEEYSIACVESPKVV